MSYRYVSQKHREYDLFLRNTRALPLEAVHDKQLWGVLSTIEALYRKGKVSRQKAALYTMYTKRKFNINSAIVSDRHLVFLPRNSRVVEQSFFSYPQLVAIYGNRHAGKTITAWTIALRFLKQFKNSIVYVYGDVDNVGGSLIHEYPNLEKRLIIKKDYSLPQVSQRKTLVLYNELSEARMSKRSMSGENIDLDLQALRSRHRGTGIWVVYNVIKYTLFESTLRDTADIILYKTMNNRLLSNLVKNTDSATGELIKRTIPHLNKNESLVEVYMEGKGTYFGIYETNPMHGLLKAHENAEKNQKLMMTKNERDLYIYERIAELKEKGLSGEEISILLRQEGINLTARAVNIRYTKWKRMQEIEVKT